MKETPAEQQKNSGQIKGVIFDVGNTLLKVSNYDVDGWIIGLAKKRYFRILGSRYADVGYTDDGLKNHFAVELKKINNLMIPSLERGKMPVPQFELEVARILSGRAADENVDWAEFFRGTLERNEEVINIAANLHKKGIKTAYLSNLDAVQNDIVYEMVGGSANFNFQIPSYKLGFRKQEPEAYIMSADLMGFAAYSGAIRDVLLIDDSPKYIELAKSVGMQTITFKGDVEELRKNLDLKLAVHV